MPITPTTYLYASTAVGLAQVADAAALLKYKERVGALATVFESPRLSRRPVGVSQAGMA